MSVDVEVREFDLKFAEGVTALHRAVGWPFSPNVFRVWRESYPYSRVFVAVMDGRVLGKVTLDMAYQPYAEIVNLMVHPDYRGHGVGSGLLRHCLNVADNANFNIAYLMTETGNRAAHGLYEKFGFAPSIVSRRRGMMWLFRFSKGTTAHSFLKSHPFSELRTARRRVAFMGRSLYRVRWLDPIGGDMLALYFKGQPGQPSWGIAPRISGVHVKSGGINLKVVAEELISRVDSSGKTKAQLTFLNEGEETVQINKIEPLIPKGVELVEGVEGIELKPKRILRINLSYRLTEEFNIPPLSFSTIVLSSNIWVARLEAPLLVSAGFEPA